MLEDADILDDALGMLETTGLTPALVALDVMEKSAPLRILQAELNDLLGVCIKVQGRPAAVETALRQGHLTAEQMGGRPVTNLVNRVDDRAWPAIQAPPEYNPLIQQDVVFFPARIADSTIEDETVAETRSDALGFIETQGFTAVFEATDAACKTANVEVIGKEKLGGGYVTVIIRGDVAAVKSAVEAGKSRVEGLGQLIASHVIARAQRRSFVAAARSRHAGNYENGLTNALARIFHPFLLRRPKSFRGLRYVSVREPWSPQRVSTRLRSRTSHALPRNDLNRLATKRMKYPG